MYVLCVSNPAVAARSNNHYYSDGGFMLKLKKNISATERISAASLKLFQSNRTYGRSCKCQRFGWLRGKRLAVWLSDRTSFSDRRTFPSCAQPVAEG